jgi:hypothetical protein
VSWITQGAIDIQVDYTLPGVTETYVDPWDETAYKYHNRSAADIEQQEEQEQKLLGIEPARFGEELNLEHLINIKLRLNLRNLNASVPLNDPESTYMNLALVQPLVAYINTNYVSIPIRCHVAIPLVCAHALYCIALHLWYWRTLVVQSNFEGSYYPAEAGMYDALSEAVYNELVHQVQQQKQVSKLADAFVLGINGIGRAIAHMWRCYFVYSYNYSY